jgi:hypothetical protein
MRQGQREGLLEVVYIDEIANLVRIRNGGTLVELTFSTNAVAAIDPASQRFVDQHTRAHEIREQEERIRRERERAQFERTIQRVTDVPGRAEQAIPEQQ